MNYQCPKLCLPEDYADNSPETQRLLSNLTESACIHVDVELVYRSGGDICGDLKWKECGIGLSLYPQMLLWYMTKTYHQNLHQISIKSLGLLCSHENNCIPNQQLEDVATGRCDANIFFHFLFWQICLVFTFIKTLLQPAQFALNPFSS